VTTVVRWIVVAVLVGHGLIHFLGVAEGFGWAEVPALKAAIGVRGDVLWLFAATLVLGRAVFIAKRAPTWCWVVAVCAAAVSQVAITTSWSDAKAGTVVNVILVLAAGFGLVSLGPTSFHTQWRTRQPGHSPTSTPLLRW
jgi:hypothetical protein